MKNIHSYIKSIFYFSISIFLLLAAIHLFITLYGNFEDYNYKKKISDIVSSNKVVIDQEIHEWVGDGLVLKLYIQNKSETRINGDLLFTLFLNNKGLEKQYVENKARKITELQKLKTRLDNLNRNDVEYEILNNKYNEFIKLLNNDEEYKAIQNYISRGYRFLPDSSYEPIAIDKYDIYTFNFNYNVNLDPNEIKFIEHKQIIPPKKRGYIVEIKISGINTHDKVYDNH